MRWKKTIKIAVTIVLVTAIAYVGDIFLGNPISYGIVKWHSRQYIQETYPNLDLRVENIYHDWYNGGGYDVRIVSDASRDTKFELAYNRLGQLVWDGYEMAVASGRNTWSRLYEEYTALVCDVATAVFEESSCYAGLSVIDEYSLKATPLPEGIHMAELELDQAYDVAALGGRYGYISLNLIMEPEELTIANVAQRLISFHDELIKRNIGYVMIDLFAIAKDTKDPDRSIGIHGITADDLNAENAAQRLEQMYREQLSYWNSPK